MDDTYKQLITRTEEASSTIAKYFGQGIEAVQKSTTVDLRTKADTETEEKAIEAIEEIFPEYNINAEETGSIDKGSEYTFFIDPLDGTHNFAINFPIFSTSVGLMKNNEIIFGVIHMPILKASYYAYKGEGAFLNDKQIHVNSVSNIADATMEYVCGYALYEDRMFEVKRVSQLTKPNPKRVMRTWSPAYIFCLLASGKIEAIINEENEMHDMVAGKLLVTEAGGKITDFSGKVEQDIESSNFIASNGTRLHDTIVSVLK